MDTSLNARFARIAKTRIEDRAIQRAQTILTSRLAQGNVFTHLSAVKQFLCLQAAHLTHEVFAVMFLDTRNRLIAYEPMFRGTINRITVYPREVARQALAHNATAVVAHHNHPSGDCTPSVHDLHVTQDLQDTLRLIDVEVLDHIVTGGDRAWSMAESGLWPAGGGRALAAAARDSG